MEQCANACILDLLEGGGNRSELPEEVGGGSSAYEITSVVYHVLSVCIILIGIVGNASSIAVFYRNHVKIQTSSYYLTALSFSDLGYLLSVALVNMKALGVDLMSVQGLCQVLLYVSANFSFLSVWFVVAFTAERFIAVQFPLQRKLLCSADRTKLVIKVLMSLSSFLHVYLLVLSGVVTETIEGEEGPIVFCDILRSYEYAMMIINYFDSLLTLFVPLLVITVLNAATAYRLIWFLRKYRVARQSMRPVQGSKVDHKDGHLKRDKEAGRGACAPERKAQQPVRNAFVLESSSLKSDGRRRNDPANARVQTSNAVMQPYKQDAFSTKSQTNILRTLLTLSLAFLVLNVPSHVLRIHVYRAYGKVGPTHIAILQQVFMLLFYMNHSINFILYSLCDSRFRKALKKTLLLSLCDRRKHIHTFM